MRRRQQLTLVGTAAVSLPEDPSLDDLLLDPPVDTNTLGPIEKPEVRTAASSAVSASGWTTQDLRRASSGGGSRVTSQPRPGAGSLGEKGLVLLPIFQQAASGNGKETVAVSAVSTRCEQWKTDWDTQSAFSWSPHDGDGCLERCISACPPWLWI